MPKLILGTKHLLPLQHGERGEEKNWTGMEKILEPEVHPHRQIPEDQFKSGSAGKMCAASTNVR